MDIHAFKAWAEPEDLSTRTAVMWHDESPTRDGSEGQQRCDFMEPEDGLQEWRGCGKPACGLWAGSTMLAVPRKAESLTLLNRVRWPGERRFAPHDLPTASKLCGGHVIDAWSAKTATRWLVKAQIFPLGCEARPQTGLVFERMLGVRRGSAIAQLTGQSHLAGGGAVSSRTALPG
ncbi:hypothetical protein UVI_02015560 [Ustilaginoidea virens]|uniref:Uncharacterized protein n=1 Tax=Ustilaginoidea virens TaxID=1159556 RepID=A0A1B5KRX4_USTVR|nr:hypothetical protein UVI_02015560 [Ustilaginoidea virens]